jgi:hypothetical protein
MLIKKLKVVLQQMGRVIETESPQPAQLLYKILLKIGRVRTCSVKHLLKLQELFGTLPPNKKIIFAKK